MAPFYYGGWLWAALAVLFTSRMSYEWVRMTATTPSRLAYVLPIIGIIVASTYAVQGFWVYSATVVLITAAISAANRLRSTGTFWGRPWRALYIGALRRYYRFAR